MHACSGAGPGIFRSRPLTHQLSAAATRSQNKGRVELIFNDWEALSRRYNWGMGEEAYSTRSGPAVGGEEEIESMRIPRREHVECTHRFEAQQRDGVSISRRIAKAMARMPRATRLVLDDDPDTTVPAWATAAPTTAQWLVAPTSWAVGLRPSDSAAASLLSIHSSRFPKRSVTPASDLLSLPSLRACASTGYGCLPDFPLWLAPERRDPLPLEVADLQADYRSLCVFDFTSDYEPNSYFTDSLTCLECTEMSTLSELRTGLHEILEWMLASSSLKQVQVDLQMVHSGIPCEVAMPNPPWPHTQVLHLQDGVLVFAGFARFLEATSGGGGDLEDFVRTTATPGSLTVRLRRPLGAEFDDPALQRPPARTPGRFLTPTTNTRRQ
ncbi:hypothetical protein N657DRAFT_636253 [Parathielavia appendiculata]|uniref:Uncharacterized protein n=1 Tax=Parathielavia appendiculata TaxID=2587402 RepID=A0AAN6TVS5_9PEZI|nr:hypothetical protein N657DRAFT_636253 [Parathielavia appendiculata]